MRWIQVQSNRTGSVRVPPARGQPEEVERFPPERQRVLNPGIHQGGGGTPLSSVCLLHAASVQRGTPRSGGGHPQQHTHGSSPTYWPSPGTPQSGYLDPSGQGQEDYRQEYRRQRRRMGGWIGGRASRGGPPGGRDQQIGNKTEEEEDNEEGYR